MKRTDYFLLTIHHWPAAAEAGVRPVIDTHFEEGPEFYRPDEIMFEHRPTRDDMMEVIHQTPWRAHSWSRNLDTLKTCQFPLCSPMHKRAETTLFDKEGREVGKLVVTKETVYNNENKLIPMVGCSDTEPVLIRLRKTKREEARKYLDRNANRVRELWMTASRENGPTDMQDIVRQVLREGGFLGRSKAAV